MIRRVAGELADLAEKAAAEAAVLLRNARRAVPRTLSGQMRGRLRRALVELAVTIERTTRIQPRSASGWLGRHRTARPGWSACMIPMPARSARDASTRRWSSATRPRSPTTTAASSPATASNTAPDSPQLAPAVQRIRRRTERVPRAVTADRGYGQPAAERDLQELGMRTVAIPRQAKTSPTHKTLEHSRGFRRLVKCAPAQRGGSAISNAPTAGTARGWTAGGEPRSGAGTGYSSTTCSRSELWPANPASSQASLPAIRPSPRAGLSPEPFQVEVATPRGSNPRREEGPCPIPSTVSRAVFRRRSGPGPRRSSSWTAAARRRTHRRGRSRRAELSGPSALAGRSARPSLPGRWR